MAIMQAMLTTLRTQWGPAAPVPIANLLSSAGESARHLSWQAQDLVLIGQLRGGEIALRPQWVDWRVVLQTFGRVMANTPAAVPGGSIGDVVIEEPTADAALAARLVPIDLAWFSLAASRLLARIRRVAARDKLIRVGLVPWQGGIKIAFRAHITDRADTAGEIDLAICRAVVIGHGGRITCSRRPFRQIIWQIFLPASQGSPTAGSSDPTGGTRRAPTFALNPA